jgi:hypothetical protein
VSGSRRWSVVVFLSADGDGDGDGDNDNDNDNESDNIQRLQSDAPNKKRYHQRC